MKLRKYAPEDAAVIARWLRSEEEVYLWSADRIGAFPVPEDALNKIYATVPKDTEFVPVTAVDGEGRPVGHLFLRIKQKEPERIVRVGFVILAPEVRGQGNGERLLIQALLYARNVLQAEKASLGVFLNNPSALHCYEKVGFVPEANLYRDSPPALLIPGKRPAIIKVHQEGPLLNRKKPAVRPEKVYGGFLR